MYTLGVISDTIAKGVHGIFIVIDCTVYRLIGWAYNIFMALSSARLMSTETYTNVASNLQVIIGVAMLFVLSYAILTSIVDPDKATKGDMSGQAIFKGVVIAVVGLALAPLIFNLLYQAQGIIMEHDVIGRIFFRSDDLNYTVNGNNVNEYIHELGGYVTAVSVWQAVFHTTDGVDANSISVSADEYQSSAFWNGLACVGLGIATIAVTVLSVFDFASTSGLILPLGVATVAQCSNAIGVSDAADEFSSQFGEQGEITLETAYAYAAAGGNFNVFVPFLDKYDSEEIEYFWPVSTICGLFALYAFISFSFDMGIRAAKLAFYQIIAPIPIIIQVLPKKKEIFNQYIKQVISTFLEVFIRIAVVYIVVFIICHLTEIFATESIFSSNSNLGTASKMFALALLIMGLIAFAKEAPKLISDTLGIKSAGGLHLGMRDKLAKGGFWNAKTIGATGLREGAQSFREAYGRNADKGLARGIGAGLLHGAGSALWGAGRATLAQTGTLTKPHHDVTNAQDAKNMENSIVEEDSQRRSDHADAVKKRENAFAAVHAAERELESLKAQHAAAAEGSAEKARLKQQVEDAEKALTDARKAAYEATITVTAAGKIATKIDAWSTGTIDTSKEEAAIKFGKAMDGLKGTLREEAYKKDATARQLYEAYNTEKAKPVSEYADGWDEQSANAEYRRRRDEYNARLATDAGLQTRQTTLDTAKANLDALRASGIDETDARMVAARGAVDTARSDLQSALNAAGLHGTVGADCKIDFYAGIKIDQAEARRVRDEKLEGLRIAMEAAADAFVHKKAQEQDSNTYRDIQAVLSEYSSYIAQNGDEMIVTGYAMKSDGTPDYSKPIREKLSVAVEKAFGPGSSKSGKFNPNDEGFVTQNSYDIELTSGGIITYKYDRSSKSYVPYDKDGHAVTDPSYPTYGESDFFAAISKQVTAGKFKKATPKTAISEMADKGKASYTYVTNNDLAEKELRKKQTQDAKNGGKK